VNLSIRQHVAAVGRRVATVCKGEDGLRQQLVLYHVYDNFCLPHASLRIPFVLPEPTNGPGSAKRWQPQTPAMAAGLTDHVWSLREMLLFRGPPWPQPGGYEQVGWEEAAWGGGLSRRRAVAWPASRASPGEESRWDAMSTLSSRAFCSCDSRRGSLRYLSAAQRYTTQNCLLDCDITLIEETGLNWETLYCPHQDCPCYGKPFTAGLLVKNGSSCG